jgi:uncharacterized protein (DUF1330 family)
MASFFLAEIEVFDAEMYRTYTELASQIVQQYGGVYIFRSDCITPVSGNWEPHRLVLIRFHSPQDIHRCFASEEYLAIKHLREQSTKSRAIIIEEA